jgi:hypothetical protein
MTTGLSYDFFASLNIDFYSEGLDWAIPLNSPAS